MTRAELLALAARVEAAIRADQILDAAVLLTVSPELASRPWEQVTYPDRKRSFFADRSDPDGSNVVSPPAYTSSLDAAASLADRWAIAALGDMVADGLPGAVLLLSTDPVKHVSGIGYGTRESGCLARALTAAALRAMAQEAGDE